MPSGTCLVVPRTPLACRVYGRYVKRPFALVALVVVALAAPAATSGQETQQVRLAASSSCMVTPGCGLALKRIYKLDVSSLLVTVRAGEGISALDAGTAEVGVAFSTNPAVSRPDIVSLRDDKHAIGTDNIVPVISIAALKRAGRAARRRLDAASAILTTLTLRDLNQQEIDGRSPRTIAADFVDANGLGGSGRINKHTKLVVGYQNFPENEILAHVYAEALRAGGYDARVRAIRGLRAEAVTALKKHTIDLYPAYAWSLASFLTNDQIPSSGIRGMLVKALAKIGAEPTKFAPGSDEDVFVVKRSTADALGISKLSDMARYWPAAAR